MNELINKATKVANFGFWPGCPSGLGSIFTDKSSIFYWRDVIFTDEKYFWEIFSFISSMRPNEVIESVDKGSFSFAEISISKLNPEFNH